VNTQLNLVVEASIQLELNVADLYAVFHHSFPKHADFWWKLRLEERNHAALIRSAQEQFDPVGKFPVDLISSQLNEITGVNQKLSQLIDKYREQAPSESEAFSVALLLEQSAGEVHYQKFMDADAEQGSGCRICAIFQRLNEHDKDHAERIQNQMDSHGIPPISIDF
jgi:hypothetical protein